MNDKIKIDFIKISEETNKNLFAGPKNGKILLKKIISFWNYPKIVELCSNNDIVISSSFYFGLLYPIFKNKSYEYISSHIIDNGFYHDKKNNSELERAIKRIIEKKRKFPYIL